MIFYDGVSEWDNFLLISFKLMIINTNVLKFNKKKQILNWFNKIFR
jgi:hypothetical protein